MSRGPLRHRAEGSRLSAGRPTSPGPGAGVPAPAVHALVWPGTPARRVSSPSGARSVGTRCPPLHTSSPTLPPASLQRRTPPATASPGDEPGGDECGCYRRSCEPDTHGPTAVCRRLVPPCALHPWRWSPTDGSAYWGGPSGCYRGALSAVWALSTPRSQHRTPGAPRHAAGRPPGPPARSSLRCVTAPPARPADTAWPCTPRTPAATAAAAHGPPSRPRTGDPSGPCDGAAATASPP